MLVNPRKLRLVYCRSRGSILSVLRGVCVISPGGWTRQGGIEAYARSVVTSLKDFQPGIYADILDSRGSGPLALSPLYVAKAALAMIMLRIRGKIDVAHIQVSERGSFVRKFVLVWVAHLLGLQVVLHHHGAEAIETYATAPSWLKAIVRSLTKTADVNVVLGAPWANWLLDEIGVPKDRVQVLYNGIPDLEGQPEPPSNGDVFRPLLLAVLSDRKGVGEFLRALSELKAHDISFEATVAGGGPDLPRFQKLAVELGIAEQCDFPGWVEPKDVPKTMAQHDCYVLPSYKEGLPIGILEAMRASRPVIATDVGSISEAIPADHGVNLVDPGDVQALTNQLARLAKNPEMRRSEGQAARAIYLEKFTLTRHIKALLSIYKRDGTLQEVNS